LRKETGGRTATGRLCGQGGGGIMELTLTGPERFVLRETLEKAINDMLMEIANTDNRKMREGLKEREELLKTILAKIPAVASSAA
jgi:hypothetical protein